MTTQERRAAILEVLSRSHQPVSAGALARRFGVSRQLIVGLSRPCAGGSGW